MHQLRFAYNTNGCAHHRLPDAIELIAKAGYEGVALTLDWHHLDPFSHDWGRRTMKLHHQLQRVGLGCVIETGARFLLRSDEKHEPTLLNPEEEGRVRRIDFLKRAIEIAAQLEAETVSFWAGVRQESVEEELAWKYLREGVSELLSFAHDHGVVLSLEPEPGHLVETNADYDRLLSHLPNWQLRLALDVGHVWVTGESEPAEAVVRYADRLGTVAIEGMNRGVHVHLPLHEGDMDLDPILQNLQRIEYNGLVCVELSRESHRAHQAIPESVAFLKQLTNPSTPA